MKLSADTRARSLLLAGVVALALALSGCETALPKDAFLLKDSALELRQQQSRLYETHDEVKLLAAGIAVLQDMGFTIDEAQKTLGLVSASRSVDARRNEQMVGAVIIILLGGQPPPIDSVQHVRVSLVTTPSRLNRKGYIARITFQRIIINDRGIISRVETINNKELYDEFFVKLSKSVFLEGHQL